MKNIISRGLIVVSAIASVVNLTSLSAEAGSKFKLVDVTPAYNYTQNFTASFNRVYNAVVYLSDAELQYDVLSELQSLEEYKCLSTKKIKVKRTCVRKLKAIAETVENDLIANYK